MHFLEKINAVLVLLDEKKINHALGSLNLSKVNIVTIVVENGKKRLLSLGGSQTLLISFSDIQEILSSAKNLLWIISGYTNNENDIWKTKKFLIGYGVPENNIVNFEVLSHISTAWLGNLRYIEKNGADFFATGMSYTEVGLNLNFLPHVRGKGVNLSDSSQDLQQSYLTAKYVFEHVKPGTIKFVLIGLTPYSFRYDNSKDFAGCSRNLQYMFTFNLPDQNIHDRLLRNLVSDNIKKLFTSVTAENADLNFDRIKTSFSGELPAQNLINWEVELENLSKKFYPEIVEKNLNILRAYIKLCLDNGAKPIGVVFPFAPPIRKNYSKELLTIFRLAIRQIEKDYNFTCVDLFSLNFDYDCFYNMTHLNLRGSTVASTLLFVRLQEKNLLPKEGFLNMNYEQFDMLSNFLSKDNYNALMEYVFAKSAQFISRKNKIKVGFILFDSSMWCGDDLYNFFNNDERFEPTIFFSLLADGSKNKLVNNNFLHGLEQFKSRNLNVVAITDQNFVPPTQDVLIFLTPYQEMIPPAFRFEHINVKTLITYIPYAFDSSRYYDGKNIPLIHLAYKVFLHSDIVLNFYDKICKVGLSRGGVYSGYPKMDVFFKSNEQLHFDWKIARPNSKKIIWAPHWSIVGGVRYATFQWNYKFMYEFAKAHPEISWVVKPHPHLLFSAVTTNVFPSNAAFEKYLQDWNDLPNAQVYTGAYYQGLFATSDGIIHDCGSFTSEYQYTHKPMIFLTREGEQFNELGEELMKHIYCVDGKNLNEIAALMKKVFIKGKDPKFGERMKFFNEHMNYFKTNGMTASEFIYKNISDALKG